MEQHVSFFDGLVSRCTIVLFYWIFLVSVWMRWNLSCYSFKRMFSLVIVSFA